MVNQVAETLSKINKAEDFTKQQEYIRQCSSILRIDEGGLTTLVNKYKRDRVSRDEKKQGFEEINSQHNGSESEAAGFSDNDLLLNQGNAQEQNVLRVLLEYGLNEWDETRSMAQYIFEELEQFHFENPELEHLFDVYRDQYNQGLEPTSKTLLYHPDANMRNLVVTVTMFPYELSQRWDEIMENMHILNRDTSREDVLLSVNYFKLHKIKKMFDENQRDMEQAKTFEEQIGLVKVHKQLKEIEMHITKELGTVILK